MFTACPPWGRWGLCSASPHLRPQPRGSHVTLCSKLVGVPLPPLRSPCAPKEVQQVLGEEDGTWGEGDRARRQLLHFCEGITMGLG